MFLNHDAIRQKNVKKDDVPVDRPGQLCVPEKRRQKLEEVDKELSVDRPPLLVVVVEDLVHEEPVRNNLQPGVGEARSLLRTQDVKHVAVSSQHLLEKPHKI